MTDKPTPKEIGDLFVEETGFDIDDFPAAILDFARAVLAKWGQPAQAAEPVAREPLTPERLREIERMCVYANTATLIDFARAIERAHGIKGGQHGAE